FDAPTPAAASARSKSASVKPPRPSAPAVRKCRRVTVSWHLRGLPKNENMNGSFCRGASRTRFHFTNIADSNGDVHQNHVPGVSRVPEQLHCLRSIVRRTFCTLALDSARQRQYRRLVEAWCHIDGWMGLRVFLAFALSARH